MSKKDELKYARGRNIQERKEKLILLSGWWEDGNLVSESPSQPPAKRQLCQPPRFLFLQG